MKELRQKLKALRSENVVVEGVQTNRAILFLNDLLSRTNEPGERTGVFELLAAEYLRAGFPEKEIEVLRMHAEENPDDPLPWISLATELSNLAERVDEAICLSNQALEKAVNCNRFVRYVLGARARIAICANNSFLFGESIKSIIDISVEKREADIGFERDFIDNCPVNFVCQSLVDAYLATNPRSSD